MWKIESKKRSRRGVEGGTNGESFQVWSSKKREKKGGGEKCVMAEVKTKGLSSLRNTRYYKYKQHQQQQHRAESKQRAFLCNIFNQSFWASWIPRHAAAAHDNLSYHIMCVYVYCIAITWDFCGKEQKKISSRWPILFSLNAATDGSWLPLMFNDVKQKPRLIADAFIFSI